MNSLILLFCFCTFFRGCSGGYRYAIFIILYGKIQKLSLGMAGSQSGASGRRFPLPASWMFCIYIHQCLEWLLSLRTLTTTFCRQCFKCDTLISSSHRTHVRMSYVLNSYLLTHLLTIHNHQWCILFVSASENWGGVHKIVFHNGHHQLKLYFGWNSAI